MRWIREVALAIVLLSMGGLFLMLQPWWHAGSVPSQIKTAVARDMAVQAEMTSGSHDGAGARFNIAPAKLMDNVFFFENASFNVLGKDLTQVSVLYRPFPSAPEDRPRWLGNAVLKSSKNGWQFWQLPVPQNLDAAAVFAVTVDTSGETFRWAIERRVLSAKTLQNNL